MGSTLQDDNSHLEETDSIKELRDDYFEEESLQEQNEGSCPPSEKLNIQETIAGDENPQVASQKNVEEVFRWRKYGQKKMNAQGINRTYFRCLHPGCGVKKHVLQHQGQSRQQVTYFGTHSHPAPTPPGPITRLNLENQASLRSTVILRPSTSTSISTGDPALSKNVEPHLVVTAAAGVDAFDDGYYWRKYGQKKVKGSPNPRSYYRCSEASCPARKQVEQLGDSMATTYQGSHDHPAPVVTNTSDEYFRKREYMRKRRKLKANGQQNSDSCIQYSSPGLPQFAKPASPSFPTNVEFRPLFVSNRMSNFPVRAMTPSPPPEVLSFSRLLSPVQDIMMSVSQDGDYPTPRLVEDASTLSQ